VRNFLSEKLPQLGTSSVRNFFREELPRRRAFIIKKIQIISQSKIFHCNGKNLIIIGEIPYKKDLEIFVMPQCP